MAKQTPANTEENTRDEHHGHGGSYVVGGDGKRVLQERTAPSDAVLAPDAKAPDQPKE